MGAESCARITSQACSPELEAKLDALEAQGLKPKVGCRMGVCHSCVCTRAEGTTLDLQTGEQDAQPGIDVRICMTRARTDLTLDL